MADPPTGNDLSAKAVYRDPPALSYPPAHSELHASSSPPLTIETRSGLAEVTPQSKLGTEKEKKTRGEHSGSATYLQYAIPRTSSGISRVSRSSLSYVQQDLYDVESSDLKLEEGKFIKHELDFEVVRNMKRFSCQKGKRSRGPKIN